MNSIPYLVEDVHIPIHILREQPMPRSVPLDTDVSPPETRLAIATIRNPYDWLVSIYLYGRANQVGGRPASHGRPERRGIDGIAQDYSSFEDFIIAWCTGKWDGDKFSGYGRYHLNLWNSVASYHALMIPRSTKPPVLEWACDVPILIRTEKVKDGMKEVALRCGIPEAEIVFPPDRVNACTRDRDYRSFYTAAGAAAVEERYHQELEVLGYTFDGCDDEGSIYVDPNSLQMRTDSLAIYEHVRSGHRIFRVPTPADPVFPPVVQGDN